LKIIGGLLLSQSAFKQAPAIRDRQQPASTPTRVACITATALNSEAFLEEETVSDN
jgi:hypothetical protein